MAREYPVLGSVKDSPALSQLRHDPWQQHLCLAILPSHHNAGFFKEEAIIGSGLHLCLQRISLPREQIQSKLLSRPKSLIYPGSGTKYRTYPWRGF